jgi:putative toxin-antitoxin system antitoxin component (TIGR02293 family)
MVAPVSDALPPRNVPAEAFRLLGGPEIGARDVTGPIDAHDLIVGGLPAKSLLHLVNRVSILATGDALNRAIGISLRTLQRRKADAVGKSLSAEQSSRAWRFAEVLAQASSVLGGQTAAEDWMMKPALGLDGRRPIDLLSSSAGAEAVAEHLTRLEYGVYV